MRIKPLFISLFLFFLLIIDIIHSNLISSTLNEQLVQLNKNGISINTVTERSSLFSDSKSFILSIDQIDKLVEELFGIDRKDSMTISLSKYEGTSFKVTLSHFKYIFSNKIHIHLSLESLPEQFTQNSTLLANIINYFQENSKLLKIDFNIWNKEFTVHIKHIDQTIQGDQDISYHTVLEALELNGLILNKDHLHLWGTTKKFDLSMMDKDANVSKITTQNLSVALQRSPELWQLSLSLGALDLYLNSLLTTHIGVKNLDVTQNHTIGENISLNSKLNLDMMTFKSEPYDYSLHGFSYDILFSNLNHKALTEMSGLINDTNTNPLSFIVEDLEKRVNKLLESKTSLKINHLKFNELILNEVNYEGVKVDLFAQNDPSTQPNTIDFDLHLAISPILFKYFNEEVVNADLTQAYVIERDNEILFHLKLTPEGFELNDHLLKESTEYQNDFDDNITSEDDNDTFELEAS